jgi:hypothetical protein
MSSQELGVVADEPRLSSLRADVANLIRRTDSGRLTLLKEDGWIAVPVRSSAHLAQLHLQRLHDAWSDLACRVAFAILLEPLRGVPEASETDTSLDGIRMFNRQFAHFNVALYTPSPKAIVICTTDDYFVIAGPEKFVTVAVGGSISEAYTRFAVFGAAAEWSEKGKAFFASILTALRDEYPRLRPGGSLTLPS